MFVICKKIKIFFYSFFVFINLNCSLSVLTDYLNFNSLVDLIYFLEKKPSQSIHITNKSELRQFLLDHKELIDLFRKANWRNTLPYFDVSLDAVTKKINELVLVPSLKRADLVLNKNPIFYLNGGFFLSMVRQINSIYEEFSDKKYFERIQVYLGIKSDRPFIANLETEEKIIEYVEYLLKRRLRPGELEEIKKNYGNEGGLAYLACYFFDPKKIVRIFKHDNKKAIKDLSEFVMVMGSDIPIVFLVDDQLGQLIQFKIYKSYEKNQISKNFYDNVYFHYGNFKKTSLDHFLGDPLLQKIKVAISLIDIFLGE